MTDPPEYKFVVVGARRGSNGIHSEVDLAVYGTFDFSGDARNWMILHSDYNAARWFVVPMEVLPE